MTALLPGETIRWQGRPGSGTRPDMSRPGQILFGFAFVAFSLFWMDKAREDGLIWLAGLPFLVIGLKLSVWTAWKPRLRAKFAHYTITDRRVIVELRWPLAGTRTEELTLGPGTIIDTDGNDPVTISVGQSLTGQSGTRRHTLVLSRIEDGADALSALRTAQRGAP